MIIWLNGAFGSGKTSVAYELLRRMPDSFVYDPEQAGYFIRKNSPQEFSSGDFQDIPLWREINFRLINIICEKYKGTVIIPMTLVNRKYFDEIIGRLRENGLELRHFILCAGKETIVKRLNKRSLYIFRRESFAKNSIERCLHAFENHIIGEKIDTEANSISECAELVAKACGKILSPDKLSFIGKKIYRIKVWFGHIR